MTDEQNQRALCIEAALSSWAWREIGRDSKYALGQAEIELVDVLMVNEFKLKGDSWKVGESCVAFRPGNSGPCVRACQVQHA